MLLETVKTRTARPALNDVFPPSSWKNVLSLLGLIIVADKKVLKEEVDTYLDTVVELRILIDPTVSLSRHMAKDWFMLNKSRLEAIIDSLEYDSAILDILAPIKSMPHKSAVVDAMFKIAMSDEDFSKVEQCLIKKTIIYWNIEVNVDPAAGDYIDAPKIGAIA